MPRDEDFKEKSEGQSPRSLPPNPGPGAEPSQKGNPARCCFKSLVCTWSQFKLGLDVMRYLTLEASSLVIMSLDKVVYRGSLWYCTLPYSVYKLIPR